MYISVFMGPVTRGPHEDGPLIDLCLEQAELAAKSGFCLVSFGEQHFNNYEPYCNPLLMGARLSPFLGDCYFGTTIIPLPLHHPLRLAEDLSILDRLLQGRLIVGMSAGRVGFSPDFQNFGLDPQRRIEIFDSKLDAMLKAFVQMPGQPPLEVRTEWDNCTLTGRMMPMSVRTPHPLLAIGTNTELMIEQTAARGWPVFLGPCLPAVAAQRLQLHREAMARAGFDAATVERMSSHSLVTRHVIVGETEASAWERAERMMGRMPFIRRETDHRSLREMAAAEPSGPAGPGNVERANTEHLHSWLICGTPDQVLAQVKAYADSGVRHLNTRFTVGVYQPDDIRQSFDLFRTDVLPRLSPQSYEAPPPRQFSPPPSRPM